VGLVRKGVKEVFKPFMYKGSFSDLLVEGDELVLRGEFALEQQVTDIKIALLVGQLFDGIAAVTELSVMLELQLAVDVNPGSYVNIPVCA